MGRTGSPPLVDLRLGDCLEVMKTLPDGYVDAVVTDPPYGLQFMGKEWDHGIPGMPFWIEALRVSKAGTHLLAFGGTRTYHRLACAIEDAGWEIRDTIAWVYGSGFPKSHDVSKAIDKAAGRQGGFGEPKSEAHAGWIKRGQMRGHDGHEGYRRPWMEDEDAVDRNARQYLPATIEAERWQGWGTALKPAMELIVVGRKLLEGTVAGNVLKHGTGALNVDGCRVDPTGERLNGSHVSTKSEGWDRPWKHDEAHIEKRRAEWAEYQRKATECGRWPANLIHDGSEQVTDLFPITSSGKMRAGTRRAAQDEAGSVCYGVYGGNATDADTPGDWGSAARFFYCAKATAEDREAGLLGRIPCARYGKPDVVHDPDDGNGLTTLRHYRLGGEGQPIRGKDGNIIYSDCRRNLHPTVKSMELMRYLCRLVTPPGGLVLDPFMGSGSTGKAAVFEGFQFLGIEIDPVYLEVAKERIEEARMQMRLGI